MIKIYTFGDVNNIVTGILGATSYTARELILLLSRHKNTQILWLTSESQKGKLLLEAHPSFNGHIYGERILEHYKSVKNKAVDVVFSCLPHEVSAQYLKHFIEDKKTKVIDLSADFRCRLPVYEKFYHPHPHPELIDQFQYGLTEWYSQKIKKSQYIANPRLLSNLSIVGIITFIKSKINSEK